LIVLDTSVLVDALTGAKGSGTTLAQQVADGDRLNLPAVVLFEWLRGPRTVDELELQRALFPEEAAEAAALYKALSRPRGREVDLMIASHAIVAGAALWTLNTKDFADIPNIELWMSDER